MKKRVILPILAVSFLFAGCGKQSSVDKGENKTSTETQTSSSTEVVNKTETTRVGEETESSGNSQLSNLEESKKLEEILDKVSNLNVQILNDLNDKRVLLLFNQRRTKKYKSIFIKNSHRLKVIDEISGDLIFNSTI